MEYRQVVFAMNRLSLLRRIYIQRAATGIALHRWQLPVLEHVISNDGCTQVDVAEGLHVSPASVAGSVKRLRAAGLLECKPDENDLRRNMLSATPEGVARAGQLRRIFDSVDEKAFNGFSDEELEAFYAMLCRMIKNISGDRAEQTMFELVNELKELEESKNC